MISEKIWGYIGDEPVKLFTISNKSGMIVKITSYGATITSICVKDRNGNSKDVVLGFDNLEDYLGQNGPNPYLGATVGRVANRVNRGSFVIDGNRVQLTVNNGIHHLHGGFVGFDKQNWSSNVQDDTLIFSYLSKDGEEGYPGELNVKVKYTLSEVNELCIQYEAITTQTTPISLTNHAYFNLSGHELASKKLSNHLLQINANSYTPVDSSLIPTGEIKTVTGSIYDFQVPKDLGQLLQEFPAGPNGYDVNFCINQESNDLSPILAACVENTDTGIQLEVFTNQPGIQLYTSNFFPDSTNNDEPIIGKSGTEYRKHGGFCLETQNYPNAVNTGSFPDAFLRPSEFYNKSTIFKFSVRKI